MIQETIAHLISKDGQNLQESGVVFVPLQGKNFVRHIGAASVNRKERHKN